MTLQELLNDFLLQKSLQASAHPRIWITRTVLWL